MNERTLKGTLAARLHQLRVERYGRHGAPELAEQLGIPTRTWLNYERGVTVPAEVVLKLIELTDVEPQWLLRSDETVRVEADGFESEA